MSLYTANVGEVIIKEKHRKGFGQLFRNEYAYAYGVEIEDKVISDFIRDHEDRFLDFAYWQHFDYKHEWHGKFQTAYDEATGAFVYGVAYNIHNGPKAWAMGDFFCKLLPQITEAVIFEDAYIEPDII